MNRDLPIRGGRGRGGRGDGGRGDFRGRGRGRGGPAGPAPVFTHDPPIPAQIDKTVTQKENKQSESAKGQVTEDMPSRPGYGTKGREVVLWANYFRLTIADRMMMHRYNIEIRASGREGTVAPKLAKRIVEVFLQDQNLGLRAVSDFRSTLLSLDKLELAPSGFRVAYRHEGETVAADDAKQYTIRLVFTGSLSIASLLDETTSSTVSSLFGDRQELIQALNVLLGNYAKVQPTVASLSNNRQFDISGPFNQSLSLGAGLEVIRGFFFSVRAATSRLLVNVQVKNMAFYLSGPLQRVANEFAASNGPSKPALAAFLSKLRVKLTHITRTDRSGHNIPRFKVISGLATGGDGRLLSHPPKVQSLGAGPKNVEFYLDEQPQTTSAVKGNKKGKDKQPVGKAGPSESGRYITVHDFFRQRYGLSLNSNLSVVNVGTIQNPSYVPMEVCQVRAGQPAKSKLTGPQTQQMIRFAVRRPADNALSIVTSGARMLGFDPTNGHMRTFGASIEPRMVAVPGRILPGPAIKYLRGSSVNPFNASWNLQGTKFARPAGLKLWTFLLIFPQSSRAPISSGQEIKPIMESFARKLKDMGMPVEAPVMGQTVPVRPNDPDGRIDEAVRKFSAAPRIPDLVLVVLPAGDGTALYNRVKYACDVKYGIRHVCVLDKKLAGANDQYFANVGLKVNLKLGGMNHTLDAPKLGIISTQPTMVMGIDVTHPSPGSASNAPSVAAVVASIDSNLAQWPAALCSQESRQEMVQSLTELVKGRLNLWRDKNNRTLPRNILVYRDGVSEGQYQLVLDQELPAIRKACQELYPANLPEDKKPRISIIVVGKRHHTRFYATKSDDADRNGNPRNGTVVDRGVTEVGNWDFFLQAHSAIQGTARPAHYFVVHDEIFHKMPRTSQFPSAADALEDLTHNLCYLFGRATKAVSLCPPAYYADLACERARCYLADAFAPHLSNTDGGSAASASSEIHTVQVHDRIENDMFYI